MQINGSESSNHGGFNYSRSISPRLLGTVAGAALFSFWIALSSQDPTPQKQDRTSLLKLDDVPKNVAEKEKLKPLKLEDIKDGTNILELLKNGRELQIADLHFSIERTSEGVIVKVGSAVHQPSRFMLADDAMQKHFNDVVSGRTVVKMESDDIRRILKTGEKVSDQDAHAIKFKIDYMILRLLGEDQFIISNNHVHRVLRELLTARFRVHEREKGELITGKLAVFDPRGKYFNQNLSFRMLPDK